MIVRAASFAAVVAAALASAPALAQPDACASFAWPIEDARQAMSGLPKAVSGAPAPVAFELALASTESVAFPVKPERSPKAAGTFGGYVTAAAPAKGLQVSLSDEAWIDVVQGGRLLKTAAFSGKAGCPGLRKSVRFVIESAEPLTIQISGAPADAIRVDVRGVP